MPTTQPAEAIPIGLLPNKSDADPPRRPRAAVLQPTRAGQSLSAERSQSWTKLRSNSYMVSIHSSNTSRPGSPADEMHFAYLSDQSGSPVYELPDMHSNTLPPNSKRSQNASSSKLYAQKQLEDFASRSIRSRPSQSSKRPSKRSKSIEDPRDDHTNERPLVQDRTWMDVARDCLLRLVRPGAGLEDDLAESDFGDEASESDANRHLPKVNSLEQLPQVQRLPFTRKRRFSLSTARILSQEESRNNSASSPSRAGEADSTFPPGLQRQGSAASEESVDLVAVDFDFTKVLLSRDDLPDDTDCEEALRRSSGQKSPPIYNRPLHGNSAENIAEAVVADELDVGVGAPIGSQDLHALQESSQPHSTLTESPSITAQSGTGLASKRHSGFLRYLKYYMWDRFASATLERRYEREAWAEAKPAAFVCAVFLLGTWLALALTRMGNPTTNFDRITYFGLGPPANVLPVVWVVLDMPARRPLLWQIQAFYTVWFVPSCVIWEAGICHWFDGNLCEQKDFIALLSWPMAFPPVALFILQAKRVSVFVGAIMYIIFFCVLLGPQRPGKTVKDAVNYSCFIIAILTASYLREKNYRKAFVLREQLRMQFKATQEAQIKLKIAADSNQAFASYIFHEVRVPMNTGLLACQNLTAEGVLPSSGEQVGLTKALSDSLLQMEMVLNDVLDYQRMNNGKLQWTRHCFDIHTAMQEVVENHKAIAKSRHLALKTQFDPAIDRLSRVYESDRARLNQIIANFISNACKFTTASGEVTVSTELLYPPPLRGVAKRSEIAKTRSDTAIIRFSVSDTGRGIKRDDMADAKIFSPFVRTELGRRSQGGKLSGLGLALCRRSVKLADGRLGVRSTYGHGSTFWIEIVLGIPATEETA